MLKNLYRDLLVGIAGAAVLALSVSALAACLGLMARAISFAAGA